jgi:hypothetical protein
MAPETASESFEAFQNGKRPVSASFESCLGVLQWKQQLGQQQVEMTMMKVN